MQTIIEFLLKVLIGGLIIVTMCAIIAAIILLIKFIYEEIRETFGKY